jgi:hypothetical protein
MVRVAPMAVIPGLLREFGVTPAPLLKAFGLSEETFSQPERTIAFELAGRVLNACVRATGCGHFGLLIGQRGSISTLGLVGYLAKNALDVGHALHTLVHNVDLHDRGAVPTLDVVDETVVLGCTINQPNIEGLAQISDTSLAVMWNILRGLCCAGWLPLEIHFCHDAPPHIAAYRQFFKAPLRFNAAHNAVVFSSAWMTRPIEHSDPVLHQYFLQHIQDMRNFSSQDFRAKAYQAVQALNWLPTVFA